MKNTFFFILTISTLMLSCKKDNLNDIACVSNCYLHLSHTRTSSNDNINKSIEEINYDQFDMLWLGGDLALRKKDKALVFHHNISEASLIWEYKLLKDLR